MSETVYPIRAVAKLTGVPLDTIRAWERRYGAVTPRRDARGRIYSEKEVQRLVLLRDAVARGHAIGQVAEVADDDLRELLRQTEDLLEPGVGKRRKVKAANSILGPLLKAIEAFDYVGAERELNRLAAATADPRNIVHEIALPLMRVTGERWHEGRFTIAQEHMVTALSSGLLASLLRVYGNPNPTRKGFAGDTGGRASRFRRAGRRHVNGGERPGRDSPRHQSAGARDRAGGAAHRS